MSIKRLNYLQLLSRRKPLTFPYFKCFINSIYLVGGKHNIYSRGIFTKSFDT